jgi:hypothetical protein
VANEEHLAILKQGVRAWNEWSVLNRTAAPDLRNADLVLADLDRADLGGAYFRGADLRGANLVMVDLRVADLHEADLTGVDLGGANLGRADLSAAYLYRAHLSGADLSGANLRWANLSGANLSGANLSRASLYETVFADVDFGGTIGLESCIHDGPSVIDHRTLLRSRNLPLPFLRGCGLPDSLIDYLPSLFNQPIQFYSCFISYSTKDQGFADRLHADLQDKSVRCWYAPHDAQGGKYLDEQIDRAIQFHDRLLLILSDNSIHSEWVRREILKARKREQKEVRRVLFPIRLVDFKVLAEWSCLDADEDLAQEIRRYLIPDFSNWKDHDSYQLGFEKLLRDLKSEEKLSPP